MSENTNRTPAVKKRILFGEILTKKLQTDAAIWEIKKTNSLKRIMQGDSF